MPSPARPSQKDGPPPPSPGHGRPPPPLPPLPPPPRGVAVIGPPPAPSAGRLTVVGGVVPSHRGPVLCRPPLSPLKSLPNSSHGSITHPIVILSISILHPRKFPPLWEVAPYHISFTSRTCQVDSGQLPLAIEKYTLPFHACHTKPGQTLPKERGGGAGVSGESRL